MPTHPRQLAQHVERLLTVDELAALWQVSPRSIRRMIQAKEFPVIRIGRSVRMHPSVAKRGQ